MILLTIRTLLEQNRLALVISENRRQAMLAELKQRIREVRQGPDGLLYLLTDEEAGALLRLAPVETAQ